MVGSVMPDRLARAGHSLHQGESRLLRNGQLVDRGLNQP